MNTTGVGLEMELINMNSGVFNHIQIDPHEDVEVFLD